MTDANPIAVSPAEDAKVRAAELWISNIMRGGVWLSLFLVAFGMTVTFVRHPEYRTSHEGLAALSNPGENAPTTIAEIIAGLRQFRGRAIIELGLLTLIATPVIRVATSVVVFSILRDKRFVLITLTVLVLLIFSFWVGGVE